MKNFRGRKAPSNIRNNVRVEPTSTLIESISLDNSVSGYELELPADVATKMHRLSSIILPSTVTAVTYEGITYYQARQGAWKVKFGKLLASSQWTKSINAYEFQFERSEFASGEGTKTTYQPATVQFIISYRN
jgi:hypothetical protein